MSEQFLASAALPAKQYRNVGRRDLFDDAQHSQHLRAARDNAIDRRSRRSFNEPAILRLQLIYALRAGDDPLQVFDDDRFLIKVVSAKGDCSHRMLAGLVAGGNDDFSCGGNLKDLVQSR